MPSVRQKLRELNLPQKAFLLLNNAPGRPINLGSEENQIVGMPLIVPTSLVWISISFKLLSFFIKKVARNNN